MSITEQRKLTIPQELIQKAELFREQSGSALNLNQMLVELMALGLKEVSKGGSEPSILQIWQKAKQLEDEIQAIKNEQMNSIKARKKEENVTSR